MATLLHPVDGVRLLLEDLVLDEAGRGASYRGAVLTAQERIDYRVSASATGEVALVPVAARASDRGEELLLGIARTVARHALAETPAAWPRRVLRWRKG